MRLLTLNDLHLASRPPAARVDDYEAELFELLEQVAALAKRVEAKGVLIAGDIFHAKSRVSIGLLVRLVRWCRDLQRAGVHVLVIPGNHDLLYNRYDSLPDQPLGLLIAVGAMANVSTRPGLDQSVRLTESDVVVRVVGVPFPDAMDLDRWRALPASDPGETAVILGHCFADVGGGEYFGEPVHAYAALADACPWGRVFVFGHDHADRGVVRIEDRWFVNLGALSRGAISDEDVSREIKCGLVDVGPSGVAVTQVRLRYRPAAELFDLNLRAKRTAERAHLETFVTQLAQDLQASGTSLLDRVTALSLPEAVRARVWAYIESVEGEG